MINPPRPHEKTDIRHRWNQTGTFCTVIPTWANPTTRHSTFCINYTRRFLIFNTKTKQFHQLGFELRRNWYIPLGCLLSYGFRPKKGNRVSKQRQSFSVDLVWLPTVSMYRVWLLMRTRLPWKKKLKYKTNLDFFKKTLTSHNRGGWRLHLILSSLFRLIHFSYRPPALKLHSPFPVLLY